MKKLLSLLLVFTMALLFIPAQAEEPTLLTGGWNTDVTDDDGIAACDALYAILPEDSTISPEYLLAAQVVAGTNYALLCSTASGWEVVYISVPLEGDPVIAREQVLVAASGETLCGGMAPVSEDALEDGVFPAIDGVFEKQLGIVTEFYVILGQQIVAGMNYLVLCLNTTVTETPVTAWALATIYIDLEGNAELSSVAELPLSLTE